mmetsp:Transcript_2137/g.2791  ORF Transcript_2137/g.2791 Transcript_2137/m.2791 type:complete len:237 (+) Transcript_2137:146-856(+)
MWEIESLPASEGSRIASSGLRFQVSRSLSKCFHDGFPAFRILHRSKSLLDQALVRLGYHLLIVAEDQHRCLAILALPAPALHPRPQVVHGDVHGHLLPPQHRLSRGHRKLQRGQEGVPHEAAEALNIVLLIERCICLASLRLFPRSFIPNVDDPLCRESCRRGRSDSSRHPRRRGRSRRSHRPNTHPRQQQGWSRKVICSEGLTGGAANVARCSWQRQGFGRTAAGCNSSCAKCGR